MRIVPDRRGRAARGDSLGLAAGLADEALFKRLLWIERRRSERTNTGFLLTLVNMEAPLNRLEDNAKGVIERIGTAISGATRETDITGWYQGHHTIGVLFTTLNGARDEIRAAIQGRLLSVMSQHVAPPVPVSSIVISFHFFPDDNTDGTGAASDEPSDNPSYRDRSRTSFSSHSFAAGKRLVDIAGSVAALAISSPLFVLIPVLIKLTSPGAVFYRQKRLGRAGVEFTFLKFRSMYSQNDPKEHREFVQQYIRGGGAANGVHKIQDDRRITPVGRLLRKTSLDELPQFINVLLGQMSLVGPRPPIPYEFEKYKLWHRRRVLEAKPGITGIWQVNGRSRTSFDEMVRMDLRYIRERSLWLDFKILVKTPLVVLTGDGAL